MPDGNALTPESTSPRRTPRRYNLTWCSAVLCVLAWLWNVFQPSVFAWFLLFPRWSWLLIGLCLLAAGFTRSRRRVILLITLMWLGYVVFNVEEAWSLARSITRWGSHADRGAKTIRVISLNCGNDGNQAAQEAFGQIPDLILFQESIPREHLEQIASRYGKSHFQPTVIWGPDTSIVANGRLTLRKHGPKRNWIWATWHRDDGDIEVVSLRLSPVPVRFDCWNPDCWRTFAQLRKTHETELAEMLTELGSLPEDRRIILGGDFNTPAHDASLRQLKKTYRDGFDSAGVGWGNTIVTGFTVHRIDQVWINHHFDPIQVQSIASRYSDHALVLSEVRIR